MSPSTGKEHRTRDCPCWSHDHLFCVLNLRDKLAELRVSRIYQSQTSFFKKNKKSLRFSPCSGGEDADQQLRVSNQDFAQHNLPYSLGRAAHCRSFAYPTRAYPFFQPTLEDLNLPSASMTRTAKVPEAESRASRTESTSQHQISLIILLKHNRH